MASPAQTTADPCGDSSGCCRVPLKTPQPCLSDWPYGRQCHLGDPRCARHVLGGSNGKHGNLPQLPSYSSHLVLGSTRGPLTQLHAERYRWLSQDFPITLHTFGSSTGVDINTISHFLQLLSDCSYITSSFLLTFQTLFYFS